MIFIDFKMEKTHPQQSKETVSAPRDPERGVSRPRGRERHERHERHERCETRKAGSTADTQHHVSSRAPIAQAIFFCQGSCPSDLFSYPYQSFSPQDNLIWWSMQKE